MNQFQQVIGFMSIKKAHAHLNFLKYQIGELDETGSLGSFHMEEVGKKNKVSLVCVILGPCWRVCQKIFF